MNNQSWISIHLFYSDYDFLLINGLSPFVKKLKQSNLIIKFFFIRYGEKGKHIRLRLLVEQKNINVVKEKSTYFFSLFFKKYPSSNYLGSSQEGNYENNTIEYIEYIPEIKRYGGEKALLVAEEHFHYTSKFVLELISNNENWGISHAQGKALQFYIMFINSIDLPSLFVEKLISNLYHSWEQYLREEIKDMNINTIFLKELNKNEDSILKNFNQLNSILNSKHDIDWIKEFQNHIITIDKKLNSVIKQDLKLQNLYSDKNFYSKKSNIYSSYIHMFNNRIGLNNYDELYLSFVLMKLYPKIGLKHS